MVSILFVGDKLITYQTDEVTRVRIIGRVESSWCQTDVAETVIIGQSTVQRARSMNRKLLKRCNAL